jgi:predicted Zn-dependent protease
MCFCSQGKREKALECFQQADACEPNVFEVIFHIGQTLVEMGAPKKPGLTWKPLPLSTADPDLRSKVSVPAWTNWG